MSRFAEKNDNNRTSRKRNSKSNEKCRIISMIIWMIFLGISIYFIYNMSKTNMIPTKYFSIIAGVIAGIIAVFGVVILCKKKGVKLLALLDILMILIAFVEGFGGNKISLVTDFLEKNLNSKYETNIYNVVVKSNCTYNSLEDIQGKDIVYFNDLDDKKVLETEIKKKISNAKLTEGTDIYTSLKKAAQDANYIVIVNAGNFDAMAENEEDYPNQVKVIGTIEIKTEKENTENENLDVTTKPFVVYISGIDTRSGKLPSRSLSDVNILMAINPVTKNILMIHVPRDYYVTLPDKNGSKDKLTHTGTIGGVTYTMKALDKLFEIDLDKYVRLNFNSVVKLVDSIGGIDVYSDVDYTFHSYNLPALTIYPLQYNHLNGQEALAFAKERHAYATGDRHRGENQEQVIQRVIEKMTSSKTLMSSFDSILGALTGTFETNITSENISALVKMELEDMAKWNIETYNVSGTGSSEYTYSYPNQKLYVMKPDETTIKEAVQKLDEILGTTEKE